MTRLRDIHRMARAYHWSQGDILALTLRRRMAYLDLIEEEENASLIAGLKMEP